MNSDSKPAIFSVLEEDIYYYAKAIKEVALEILENKISSYPVFVAHQHEVDLGEPILDKNDFQRKFSINASILEELVEKKIIDSDKTDAFKTIYKDPELFICIFLVMENSGNFIFLPYKQKKRS
jgi:hypothetical protein